MKESIDTLNLSSMCREALRRDGISLISDIISKSESDLLRSRELTAQIVDEVYTRLQLYCEIKKIPLIFEESNTINENTDKDAVLAKQDRLAGMPVLDTWMDRTYPNILTDPLLQSSESQSVAETNNVLFEQNQAPETLARDTSSEQVPLGSPVQIEKQSPGRPTESPSNPKVPVILSDTQLRSQAVALSKGIEVLGLSIRPFNALKRAGVDRVFDLAAQTVAQLDGIKNLGPQSFAEIRSKLQQYLKANAISLPALIALPIEVGNVSVDLSAEVPPTNSIQNEQLTPEHSSVFQANLNSSVDLSNDQLHAQAITLAKGIEVLGLSIRPFNALKHKGMHRVFDLVTKTADEIRSINNIGSQSLDEIQSKLKRYLEANAISLSATLPSAVESDNLDTNCSTTLQRLVNEVSPEHIRWAILRKKLNDELQAGRLNFDTRWDGFTITEWMQVNMEQRDEGTLQRICDSFEFLLKLWTIWAELRGRLNDELESGRLHPNVQLDEFFVSEWSQVTIGQKDRRDLQIICDRIESKLKYLTIDDELQEVLNHLNARGLAILVARFGQRKQTLQQVANGLGLTRSRVQQVEQKAKGIVSKWFVRESPWRLKTTLLLAEDMGRQINIRTWETLLRKRNLIAQSPSWDLNGTDQSLSPVELFLILLTANEGAESPAREFEFPDNLRNALEYPDYTIQEIEVSRGLSPKELRAIRRQCRNAGAVSAILLGRKLKTAVSVISKALSMHGYVPMNEEWLTLKPHPGTPISSHYSAFQVNVIKMLSLCGPLPIEEIRQGLQNHTSRFYFAVPPTSILKELLPMYGFAIGNDSHVEMVKGKRAKLTPNSGENIVLDLIKKHGPIVTFQELSEEFTKRKRSQPLLSTTLRHSVLFQRVDTGLYALRGSRITREDIETATARRPVVEQDSALKFSSDGIITWEINIGTYGLGGTIPAGEAAKLVGEWESTTSRADTGRIKVGEHRIWGLAKAFRKLDVKVGDRVALFFNPEIRQVQVVKVETKGHEED